MKKENKKKKIDIMDNVLDKIEKEDIKPIPKWKFILTNIITGIVISTGLILGIIGLTMSFVYWSRLDTDILHINSNVFEILRFILPIFWIVLIIISLAIAYFSFIKSEKGYKYSIGLILISFGLIVIGSSIFSFYADQYIRFSNQFDRLVLREFNDPRYMMWNRPDQGFIAGEVTKKLDEELYIIDFMGKSWIVDIRDTRYSMRFDIVEGIKIKIRGELINENTIKAIEIRPWDPPRRGCLQENGCGMRSIR